ncbi:MAG: hypothetical protein ABFD46_01000 [Armatimonadota bacterium]
MANDKRLDLNQLDDGDSLINKDLLKDVMEATEHAKRRKADDKARDQKQKTQEKDQKMMIAIISVATLIIFAIAYWMLFMRESPQQANQAAPTSRQQTAPVQLQPVPPQNQNPRNSGYNRPVPNNNNRKPHVVSDPVRPNSSDTYAEPQDTGGGL